MKVSPKSPQSRFYPHALSPPTLSQLIVPRPHPPAMATSVFQVGNTRYPLRTLQPEQSPSSVTPSAAPLPLLSASPTQKYPCPTPHQCAALQGWALWPKHGTQLTLSKLARALLHLPRKQHTHHCIKPSTTQRTSRLGCPTHWTRIPLRLAISTSLAIRPSLR